MNTRTAIENIVTTATQNIIKTTAMIERGWELWTLADLMIRVQSVDPVTFEYAATDGNETFVTYDRNQFVNVVASAIETVLDSQIVF